MAERKRCIRASTSKPKKMKVVHFSNKEEIPEESCSQEKHNSKKLTSLSQPILQNSLKKKLHVILANWKPPLKVVTTNENQMDVSQIENKETKEKSIRKEECVDNLADTLPTSSNLSHDISTKSFSQKNSLVTGIREDTFLNNNLDNNLANDKIEDKVSPEQDKKVTETIYFSDEHSLPLPSDQTLSLANKSQECILKQEDIISEEVNKTPTEYSRVECQTPEVTGTPPTPPTLKISWLNETTVLNLSPGKSQNIHQCEDSKEPSIIHDEFANDEKAHRESDLKHEVNSNMPLVSVNTGNMKTVIKHPAVKTTNIEQVLEDDLNISSAEIDSIENKLSFSLQKESIQDRNVLNFKTFRTKVFTPKMPQMNWVHQLEENKKQLQAVVREVSQLNAMMTRAIREIWTTKKT